MEMITKKTMFKDAYAAFKELHTVDFRLYNDEVKKAGDCLFEIKNAKDCKEVDRITDSYGFERVTKLPSCDECGSANESKILRVGQCVGYIEFYAHICKKCLKKAIEMYD